MTQILNALLPVFIIISLGWLVRARGVLTADTFSQVERLTYFILYPALLFRTIATANLGAYDIGPFALGLLIALLAMTTLLGIIRRAARMGGPVYTSLFQGGLRWNGFVALAIAEGLYGAEGLAVTAVAIAVIVPTVNVFSIVALARHATDAPTKFKVVAATMFRNPLVIACFFGAMVNVVGIELAAPIDATFETLGDAALTLGLLCIGGALDFSAAFESRRLLLSASALKLLVMPAFMWGACVALGVTGLPLSIAVLCGAVPGATSSYILARQMGGDAVLMANIITATTVLAIFTMPPILFAARAFGP
jgi:hypothetical protein